MNNAMFDTHSDQVSYIMHLYLPVDATGSYTASFCLCPPKKESKQHNEKLENSLVIDIQRRSVYITTYN